VDDSGEIQIPSVVSDGNADAHLRRLRHHRLRKEHVRAVDRRKNFELGETTGFLYFVGLLSVALAASGELNFGDPGIIGRVIIGGLAIIALGAKAHIKRRFWKETLDAERKEQ